MIRAVSTGVYLPPRPAPLAGLLQRLARWRHQHIVASVKHAEVTAHVADGAALTNRFSFMVMMACGIAILGLLQNSAAVIIGAMLISPLMGPIVALGFSLTVLDTRQLKKSLAAITVGVVLALAVAIGVVLVSPLQDPTSEILARTRPNLFDLLVAVLSGLAGGYAVIRQKGETIVGVAIATALMPPLAVIGFGLATGKSNIAYGAGFLFMTNLLAIALSVTLISKWYGFGTQHSPQSTVWQGAVIVLTFAALSLPLGISLRDIATRSWLERTTRNEVQSFLKEQGARLSSINVIATASGPLSVDVVALSPRYEPGAVPELKSRLQALLAREVVVTMQQLLVAKDEERDIVRSLAQLEQSLAAMKIQQSARDPATDFQNQLTTQIREQLGAVSLDTNSRTAVVYLAPETGLSMSEARQLETRLAGIDPSWSVQVAPPAQGLPAIEFAPDSSLLNNASISDLETVHWALQRWNLAAVDVIGLASSDGQASRNLALAKARAEVVATWLLDRGISATIRPSFERKSQRPIERERGAAAFRRVEIIPLSGMQATSPLPGPTTVLDAS